MSPSVSHDVLLRCQAPSGRRTTLAATLVYAAVDPYAVRFVFHGPREDIAWLVDRQLLLAGRSVTAGEGDVVVRPGDGVVQICFRSPDGTLETAIPRSDLDAFLARTLGIVALGEEAVDADELLSALLGSEAE